ncbi:hypothetical protein MF271_19555 (plasmid) [Deinococcus sp. KNUC1210]|uniref:hypothetical protein n=1 Tax=Deinococcus sp. KNUC1210 TaxID=2917691 RepID=UPI001EF079AD|nr:hypothetical protein [Deinococcus sp. KNUC1210]ULH17389.1 hypothetical protein MF271_19555 [Deinococcus sp. KNUC1210]
MTNPSPLDYNAEYHALVDEDEIQAISKPQPVTLFYDPNTKRIIGGLWHGKNVFDTLDLIAAKWREKNFGVLQLQVQGRPLRRWFRLTPAYTITAHRGPT